MRQWSWHGLAGVILAACVGLGWSIALVVTSVKNGPVTDAGAQILNTIGGGLIGAVATWIGLAGGKKPSDPDVNTQEHTTTTTTTQSTEQKEDEG